MRGNGIPYQGINVLMLWLAAMDKGYASSTWMTFKQALELKAHVRKGEQGSLVVYADKIIRTETDQTTGEESEHAPAHGSTGRAKPSRKVGRFVRDHSQS